MPIEKLCDLYNKMVEEEDINVPPIGYEIKTNIDTVIDINSYDKIYYIYEDVEREFQVPIQVVRSNNMAANFLWDKSAYSIGLDIDKDKNIYLCLDKFDVFKELHIRLCKDIDHDKVQTFLEFLESWNPEEELNNNEDKVKNLVGHNIIFSVDGQPLTELDVLKSIWLEYYYSRARYVEGQCSITGKHTLIPKVHNKIKLRNGSMLSLVSSNHEALRPYNSSEGVGIEEAFKYTTALNKLLERESHNCVNIGNTHLVFWTEANDDTAKASYYISIGGVLSEDSDKELESLFKRYSHIKYIGDTDILDSNFYVLGLAGSLGRLAIKLWRINTIQNMMDNLEEHFNNLKLIKSYEDDPSYPSIYKLLATALNMRWEEAKKSEEFQCWYESFIDAILTGRQYPSGFYTKILQALHHNHNSLYLKMCLIKAYLIKNYKIGEDLMELNHNINKEGYVLGQVFAILEKVNTDVMRPATTLRDKFWASASTTPRRVFPILISNVHHNLKEYKYSQYVDMQLAELMSKLAAIPNRLNIEEQGLFALGYYHKKKDLYTRKEDKVMEKEDIDNG